MDSRVPHQGNEQTSHGDLPDSNITPNTPGRRHARHTLHQPTLPFGKPGVSTMIVGAVVPSAVGPGGSETWQTGRRVGIEGTTSSACTSQQWRVHHSLAGVLEHIPARRGGVCLTATSRRPFLVDVTHATLCTPQHVHETPTSFSRTWSIDDRGGYRAVRTRS